jgi:hypothetical protein
MHMRAHRPASGEHETGQTRFRSALGSVAQPLPVAQLGLEHEYELTSDGERLDFRQLIHELAVPGLPLDPGDPYAYRCASGLALTCDDEEAEVASPPLPLAPGFTGAVDDWARAGRALLDQVLPSSVVTLGCSTHLSAALPDEHADRVIELFTATFAPALMLMLDRAGSHGVFVRPRPSRLELCGEYAIGERLRAATAFFAGAAKACAGAVDDDASPWTLPPPLAVQALAAARRPGLEVDRDIAFGFDLYARGRDAVLPLQDGGTITAQRYLESAWASARQALGPHADPSDLGPAQHMVEGSSPLGVETDRDEWVISDPTLPPSPFGALLARRDRGSFAVEPALATWAFTVFRLHGPSRSAYACVPSARLSRFLDMLDDGRLDLVLAADVRSAPSGRVLAHFGQTEQPGLWDEVGIPTDLLHPERAPAENRRAGVRPIRADWAAPPSTSERDVPLAVAHVDKSDTPVAAARADKPDDDAPATARIPEEPPAAAGSGKPAQERYGKPHVEPVPARIGKPTVPAPAPLGTAPVEPIAARFGKPASIDPPPARFGKPAGVSPDPSPVPIAADHRWRRSPRVIAVVVVGVLVLVGTAVAVLGRGGSTQHAPTTVATTSPVETTPVSSTQPSPTVLETTTPRGRTVVPTTTRVTARGAGTPTTVVSPTTLTHPATTAPPTPPTTAPSPPTTLGP